MPKTSEPGKLYTHVFSRLNAAGAIRLCKLEVCRLADGTWMCCEVDSSNVRVDAVSTWVFETEAHVQHWCAHLTESLVQRGWAPKMIFKTDNKETA